MPLPVARAHQNGGVEPPGSLRSDSVHAAAGSRGSSALCPPGRARQGRLFPLTTSLELAR